MATSPERWARVKAAFEAALAVDGERRTALVDGAGLADDERAEVLELLRHHEEATGGAAFLAGAATPLQPVGAARAGQRLGAWEIVRPLGAGGMGEVFEARRADGQYEGRAAIKLLKRGMDSAAVLQRFALERQALARLNHPHIARLLDAGASDEGLPYFVLEYVEGVPIDEAARGQPLEVRLALFLQLADAVAHAHRNLLVHRDLKPGNVMVDDRGQVKLLDFGIAKALDPLEGADGDATAGGVRPYTPHYASPEQVRGEPVTTATDLYSLGVLLYLMLTGLRPTGRGASTPADAARSVLEEQPTRPSRLTAAEVPEPGWVQTRHRLEGDLDNILLKALEKPAERRYASAEGLAADLRAFLAGLPVSARAPTVGYVAGKFIRRHRLVAGLAAALVLSLVAGVVVSSWQAAQARQRLAGIKTITRDAVFRFGDAVTYVPGGMAIKADLLGQMAGVLDHLVQASGDDVDLRADAAQAYARLAEIESNDTGSALGRTEAGRRHALRALELGREVLQAKLADAEFIIWYWRALATQARQQRAAGQPGQALQTLSEVVPMLGSAVELARAEGRKTDLLALRVERARARHLVSMVLYKAGQSHLDRPEDALATLQLARTELDELERAQHHAEILYLLGSVDGAEALIHESRGALQPALAAAERAMAARQAVVAELPRDVEYRDALITEAMTLGKVLTRLERPQDALAATRLGWQTMDQLEAEHAAGPDNPWTRRRPALALHHGRALQRAGEPAAALPVLEQARGYVQRLAQDRPAEAERVRLELEAELALARAGSNPAVPPAAVAAKVAAAGRAR